MSKLDKVINQLLDIRIIPNLNKNVFHAIHNAINVLCVLAKPVQYTIELKHTKKSEQKGYSIAYLNGICIAFANENEICSYAFDKVLDMHIALALPAITIDQITFIEL